METYGSADTLKKKRPWVVAIEGKQTGSPAETVQMTAGGIATSAGFRNSYDPQGKHHHLINHRTGQSPNIISVTVTAQTAAQADALATALSLIPPAHALKTVEKLAHVECLVLTPQGRYASSGWA